MVPRHCIAVSQPVVEAICTPLPQAYVSTLEVDQYKQLLHLLAITFQECPLSQQCLLYQLLEKHTCILVFAADPKDYRCTEAINHPIHTTR